MKYELLLILVRLIKLAVTIGYAIITAMWKLTWPLFRGMFRYTPRKK